MNALSSDNPPVSHRGFVNRSSPLARILATSDDLSPMLARVALGVVMFPHGAQKMLGWFGGYGFAGTMGFLTGKMGIPAVFAVLAIVAEFFGAIGLVTGGLARIAAFGIGVVMVVAVLTVHTTFFFMNWTGHQAGEGFEYHILALALASIVMLRGAGAYSLDRWWTTRRTG